MKRTICLALIAAMALAMNGQIIVSRRKATTVSDPVYVNSGSTYINNNATISMSLDLGTGNDRVVVIDFCAGAHSQTVSSCTVAGNAATYVTSNTSQSVIAYRYYYTGNETGSQTVSMTFNQAEYTQMIVFVYNYVNQTTPLENNAVYRVTGTQISNSISSSTGELVVESVSCYDVSTLSAGSGQTQRQLITTGGSGSCMIGLEKAGAASVTMTTNSSNSYSLCQLLSNLNHL